MHTFAKEHGVWERRRAIECFYSVMARAPIKLASLRHACTVLASTTMRPGSVGQSRENNSREHPPDKGHWARSAAHDTRQSTQDHWSESPIQACRASTQGSCSKKNVRYAEVRTRISEPKQRRKRAETLFENLEADAEAQETPKSVRVPSSTRNRASEPGLHQRTLESKNGDEGRNKSIENYVAELTTDGGQVHGRHCHALV